MRKILKYTSVVLLSFVVLILVVSIHPEIRFFFRRVTSDIKLVGAIMPTSRHAAKKVAIAAVKSIENTDGFVVEIGPGTGRITSALLECGVPVDRLICIELDPELHQYMLKNFPEVRTVLGNALDLEKILLQEKCGKIATIISSIPITNLPNEVSTKIIHEYKQALNPSGQFIQFGYRYPSSGLTGLKRESCDYFLLNIPPAFLSIYKKTS